MDALKPTGLIVDSLSQRWVECDVLQGAERAESEAPASAPCFCTQEYFVLVNFLKSKSGCPPNRVFAGLSSLVRLTKPAPSALPRASDTCHPGESQDR